MPLPGSADSSVIRFALPAAPAWPIAPEPVSSASANAALDQSKDPTVASIEPGLQPDQAPGIVEAIRKPHWPHMDWHEHLRRTVKLALVGAIHYSGLMALIRKRYMRDRAVILMYHRVTPSGEGVPDYSPNGMAVTPREFEMHMRFIRAHYEVVPFSRVVSAVTAGAALPANMCVVTFDDGWRDVYRYAFPVLKALTIPATVFLTTGYAGGTAWAWQERTRFMMAQVFGERHLVLRRPDFRSVREELDAIGMDALLTMRESSFRRYILEAVRDLEARDAMDQQTTIDRLEKIVLRVTDESPRPFISWNEAQEMSGHGITFESHTVSHPVLPALTDDEAGLEIGRSVEEIRGVLGHEVRYLAYPYGKCDQRIVGIAKQQRIQGACTTRIGPVRAADDPHLLARINMSSDVAGHEALFAARLLCW